MNSAAAASSPRYRYLFRKSAGSAASVRIQGRRVSRVAVTTSAMPPATSMISNALMANSAASLSNAQWKGTMRVRQAN